jgi:hypothetical protein
MHQLYPRCSAKGPGRRPWEISHLLGHFFPVMRAAAHEKGARSGGQAPLRILRLHREGNSGAVPKAMGYSSGNVAIGRNSI